MKKEIGDSRNVEQILYHDPIWIDEDAAAIWKTVSAESTYADKDAENAMRTLFDEADTIARRWCRQRIERLGSAVDDGHVRHLFARELNSLYRERVSEATRAACFAASLAPNECRDPCAEAVLNNDRLSELRTKGFIAIDWALSAKEVLAMHKEAEVLDANGLLKPTPAFSGYQARTDRAVWFGDEVAERGFPSLAKAVRMLRGLAAPLQGDGSQVSGGGFGTLCVPQKVMLACYPGNGTRYTLHKDSDDDDPRSVTCILYMQTLAWNSDRDGGELSVNLPGEARPKRFEPKGGRLVIFDSRAVEHEVLPARGRRWAMSLWLWRAPPGTIVSQCTAADLSADPTPSEALKRSLDALSS